MGKSDVHVDVRRVDTFTRLLDLFPAGRCVDLGAGHGKFSMLAADRGWMVTAVDARRDRTPTDDRVTWVEADVRATDLAPFDLILCLGLFYHLTLDDQLDLIRRSMDRPLLIDTHIDTGSSAHRLSDQVELDGRTGRLYKEPGLTTSSWGNDQSFWPTLSTFHDMLAAGGFHTVLTVEPWITPDRTFFLALPDGG